MSERISIPKHLADSLISAEAFRQRERRTFQVEDYARRRQVPAESMRDNPTVARFMAVLSHAEKARERLGTAERRDPVVPAGSPAAIRMSAAACLYAVEQRILEEGFRFVEPHRVGRSFRADVGEPLTDAPTIDSTLSKAGKPYGLFFEVGTDWRRRFDAQMAANRWDQSTHPDPVPWSGVWTGRPFSFAAEEPWPTAGTWSSHWYWPDWPNERHDPEHMRELESEATRQGIDPAAPADDPVLHTLLTGLVYARELVDETAQVSELPAAPGLTPKAQDRLELVAPLNRLVVAVLQDGLRPGSLSQTEFADGLGPILRHYELVVHSRNEL